MGRSADAHLVYGCPAPEGWTLDDVYDKLPNDGPLDSRSEGDVEWPDMRIFLFVKGSEVTAYETAKSFVELPDPDIREVVNAGKLFAHLTGEEFKPLWWLVPTNG